MKRVSIIMILLVAAVMYSCNDYLDINENVNKPTSVAPELVFPQALTSTADNLDNFNTYGMQIGGYAANAGGYGGFNETVSYAYTPNNYSNLWLEYDNLEDYQYIIDQTKGDSTNLYLYAAAKIMKCYGFQLLVDAYNNVPYSQALSGEKYLTPVYDDATKIYDSLALSLDDAIAAIKKGQSFDIKPTSITTPDIVFKGDMTKWIKLANTIKLRLFVRAGSKVTFTNPTISTDGFLTEDALINPGYTKDNNRQNPKWDTWAFGYTGSAGNKAWIPSTFIMTYYDTTKIADPFRGSAMYYQFAIKGGTGTNQLGYEATGIPKSPDGSFWYPTDVTRKEFTDTTGVLKGPSAGYPMFLAAESYFLQSEAALRTMISGDAETLFNTGIKASISYTYQLSDGTIEKDTFDTSDKRIAFMDTAYHKINSTNYLVNFNLAGSFEEQLEAIITQKYLALNMINSHEGWNEYRRTGYPKVSGSTAEGTFASKVSLSTRVDKLPSRILYPTSEVQYNSSNVPSATTNSFTSLIFWAK
ncbi:MAG TPA: SusD/RagB family nutrient-binding outer membrane lipoprotein [Cyclobacteriaceae bacterium]|nr:SusD/RagB family nutrient-binding outer membrane lipoprotein [Cyclobacteriaceae bacterium]